MVKVKNSTAIVDKVNMKVKIPRQKMQLLDADGETSSVMVPAQDVELQIESQEIKEKQRVSICTCIVPRFGETGPCRRCGKPMTWDYEPPADLKSQHNFEERTIR